MTHLPPPCGASAGDVIAKRYHLDIPIGWGGQAVVFRATDLSHPNPHDPAAVLAVKIVRTDLSPELHAEARASLRWEAYLLRRARHVSLPRLVAFHTEHPLTWLAREIVDGLPLSAWAEGTLCDPRQVQTWAVQLCDLLSYLHTRKPPVICGDLKPANLVVRSDRTLVLIDLGAGQTRTQRAPARQRPRYGTPGYAAPEHMRNADIDERSDIFSLGVLCYELLTGLDPTDAPLQFDFDYLDEVAPMLAPALRWALEFDREQRAPTAAALRALLVPPLPTEPLKLADGVLIADRNDLLTTALDRPELVEQAIERGDLERWLASHPDRSLGRLIYAMRALRQRSPNYRRTIDLFYASLAPDESQTPLLITPQHIQFGTIPLRTWRVWGIPHRIVLHNPTRYQPIRWELVCPKRGNVEIRIKDMTRGETARFVRSAEGVIAPGGSTTVLLVAAGITGHYHGTIMVRCGIHEQTLTWEATAAPVLPIGIRTITRLDEIDISSPHEVIAELEPLLLSGAVQRWLRAQGESTLAKAVAPAKKKPPPSALQLRLFALRLLHHLDATWFPHLVVTSIDSSDITIVAGDTMQYAIEVENQGSEMVIARWRRSNWPWIRVISPSIAFPPGRGIPCTIWITPPATLPNATHSVVLEMEINDIVIPIPLTVHITHRGIVRRVMRWFRR